jgi:hypothetical protein
MDATEKLARLKNLEFAKELDAGIPSQRARIEPDAVAHSGRFNRAD